MSSLFSPITLRSLTIKNRLVVSPMCQYSAKNGVANDWHFAHLARFGMGGFGMVMIEATSVRPEGRITYADLGLWNDDQIAPLKRISDFLHTQGAASAIQIAHAGRKASTPLWWRGSFNETDAEKEEVGFADWQPVAPSAIPMTATAKMPRALTVSEIEALPDAFAATAKRALTAGIDCVEIHAAHGYLLNQFLSPVANKRDDHFGGSRENRMRLLLQIAEAVRSVWPVEKPLFTRISATDAIGGGWTLDDSLVLAKELKDRGVDVIDCSSGGFDGAAITAGPMYQVPYAKALKAIPSLATMAVGLITEPQDAENIISNGEADLIAIGRNALDDPNWPLHARQALQVSGDPYVYWPKQAGFAVRNKDRALGRFKG